MKERKTVNCGVACGLSNLPAFDRKNEQIYINNKKMFPRVVQLDLLICI